MANANWAGLGWAAIIAELHREQADPNAWAEAYRRLHEVAAREVRGVTGRSEDADDLVAEILVRLALPTDPLPGALATVASENARRVYLSAVVRNALLTRLRRLSAEKRILQDLARNAPSWHDSPTFDAEDVEQLNRKLHRLTDDEQELLKLKFWDALPLDEIARRFGITYSTAAVRLHRLLAKLRALP